MTFGSLFSGIGGFDLGFERAGLFCKWQCENDRDAIQVLAKHWPKVKRIEDVRNVRAGTVEAVDVICGGFPCQPVSMAGRRKGDGDTRWLWPEFARVINELRPNVAVLENVPGLLSTLGATVAADLADIGYDAEWDCISAETFGAPHRRKRFIALAHPRGERFKKNESQSARLFETCREKQSSGVWERTGSWQPGVAVPDRVRWIPNDRVCRIADGISGRMDKYRLVGNAILPQIAESIGRHLIKTQLN